MAKKKKKSHADQSTTPVPMPNRVWSQEYDAEVSSPVFFYNPRDAWGFLGLWYLCSFRGPPPPGCGDFPDCHQCENDRKTFMSVGHYLEYFKALHFKDEKTAEQMLIAKSQNDIQALAKTISGFKEYAWDEVRYYHMFQANIWKFGEDAKCVADDNDLFAYGESGRQKEYTAVPLRDLLLATRARELIAASAHDKIWSIGFNVMEAETHTEDDRWMWGKNLLGKALTEVREIVRNQERLKREQNV